MRFRSIALAGSAIVIATGMMGAGYANAESSGTGTNEVRETQQLNRNELSRVTPYVGIHARHVRHEASSGGGKYAQNEKSSGKTASSDNSVINLETGKTPGITHSSADRLASNVGNKIMRVMYTKRAPFTDKELRKGLPLSEVGRPEQTLSTASVETRDGDVLGEVKSVRLDAKGDPKTIKVVTGGFLGVGQHQVQMGANDFVYLPGRNVLVTNMTKQEVNKLPAVKNS